MNTKYISYNVLKISVFSRVRSTSDIANIFNTRDEIFLVFTEKKLIFSLFFSVKRKTLSFYAPKGTSGGILKSQGPSVRPSVTNCVSAISHKLLKQF